MLSPRDIRLPLFEAIARRFDVIDRVDPELVDRRKQHESFPQR